MTVPSVDIRKQDGNTGVVRPGSEGILAIIAPCEKGTANLPGSYSRPDLALAEFGYGPLTNAAAYDMAVCGNPTLLIRGTASTAGANGTVAHVGAGTSIVTATGTPLDDYATAVVTIVTGGTIGVAGIEYTYSLDGGKSTSGKQALGTATSIVIPNSGVTLALAAGTVLAGQIETVAASAPKMTNADLVVALEALRTSALPWDSVLIHADADATMVATVDTWIQAREAEGRYKTAIMNTVMRTAAQTEAQYATALTPIAVAMTSKSVVVGADGGDLPSQLNGAVQARPTSWAIAARAMDIDISADPAFVSDGPVAGFQIYDARGNPKYHDELANPGLDAMRLATLRTFYGREGVYINNAPIISSTGSDYVFLQHARVMNKASEVVYQLLTGRLSEGVGSSQKTGFILEEDAADIEGLVQTELNKQFVTPKRVSAAKFILSRTDDLSSNVGATLTGELQISALRYVKKFSVQSRFVRTITAKAS